MQRFKTFVFCFCGMVVNHMANLLLLLLFLHGVARAKVLRTRAFFALRFS
jgi:hypothetical protein